MLLYVTQYPLLMNSKPILKFYIISYDNRVRYARPNTYPIVRLDVELI